MIEVKVNKGADGVSLCQCRVEGSLKEVTTQTLEAVHTIFRAMADEGAPAPVLVSFRAKLISGLCDPRSPVWDLTDKNLATKEGQTC